MTKNNSSILVYNSGTKVFLKTLELDAFITAVILRDNSIKYEISFFTEEGYTSIWLSEYEFTISDKATSKKLELGFKDANTKNL
jgi:hypothetical protein